MTPFENVLLMLRHKIQANEISNEELLEVLDVFANHEDQVLHRGADALFQGPIAKLNQRWMKEAAMARSNPQPRKRRNRRLRVIPCP